MNRRCRAATTSPLPPKVQEVVSAIRTDPELHPLVRHLVEEMYLNAVVYSQVLWERPDVVSRLAETSRPADEQQDGV